MYSDEANAKMQAEKAYFNNIKQQATCAPPVEPYPDVDYGAVQAGVSPSRPSFSLRDEAQKRAQHHHSEGEKAQSAAQFFAMNPQFEDFIRLIRSGAIQF